MNAKQKNLIVSITVLAVVGGAIGWYLWAQTLKSSQPSNVASGFRVMNSNLSEAQKGKYLDQFNQLTKILQANPDDFDALMSLGMVKKYIGDYQGAEELWVKAGQIEPKNSTSFGDLADLYVNFLHDYDKAKVAYDTAMTNSVKDPFYPNFVRNAFYFYRDYIKDNTQAEQVLLTGLKNKPGSLDIMVLLAGFYRDQGDKSKAIYYFQKALVLDPQDASIAQEIKKLTQ